MYFTRIADFIAMGGQGFYVWLAFGFALACFAWLLVNPLLQHRQILRQLRSVQDRQVRQ